MPPGCLGAPRIGLRGLSMVHNIFEIIQLYRKNPCLWNPKRTDYYNPAAIENAWSHITRLMGGIYTKDEIKNVIYNLREYFEDESELLEMKKQEGIKAQPRHIYYYALQFLSTINTNAYESDDNRKSNIDSAKKRHFKRQHHDANITGRKRSHGGSKSVEKKQSFLCESLSEYRMKQPVSLKRHVHQGSLNNTTNMKKNLYGGMRNPEENSSKTQPVSMFLNSTAFGKPILETGLEKLSFLRDRIDTEKVAAEFAKVKNKSQMQLKKFRIYENEIYPNIFQEVKIPETIKQPSLTFTQLSEQKFNHPVPDISQPKPNKSIKLMLFNVTTGKLSMLENLRDEKEDLKQETLPSSIPKLNSSNRLQTEIDFSTNSNNNLAYQRVSSGESSPKPKESKYLLKSSSRKFNLLKSFSKTAQNCLTKSNTIQTHQLCPPNPLSVQSLATKSNESRVEVPQQVLTYIESEEKNVQILNFF